MKKNILNKIEEQHIYMVLMGIFLLSLVPILILATYNYPCADDFSASYSLAVTWRNTGSLGRVILEAFTYVKHMYLNWSGVFASMFWTSLQPGIFGEKYYGITTFITVFLLCFGVYYFVDVLLRKYGKANRYQSGIIAVLILLSMIQYMPDGNEGLYWHSGVVNYTWAFAFFLLELGLLLSSYREENRTQKTGKLFLSCFCAILVGGGNYITALIGCICLFLLDGMLLYREKKQENRTRSFYILFPAAILLISFFTSVLAPGNEVRMGMSEGFGSVKAIIVSFHYCLEMISSWMTWSNLLLLLMAVPFLWRIAQMTEYKFSYPLAAVFLGVGMEAAAFTPSLYAQGAVEAGRLKNTAYLIFVIILYLLVFYVLGWFSNFITSEKKEKEENKESVNSYLVSVFLIWCLASLLSLVIEPDFGTTSSAIRSLCTGEAKNYKAENEYRLSLLNSDQAEVVLPGFTSPPHLLFFEDITGDTKEWINQVMAEYYGKESVRRE